MRWIMVFIMLSSSVCFAQTNETISTNSLSTNEHTTNILKKAADKARRTIQERVQSHIKQSTFKVSGSKTMDIRISEFAGNTRYKPPEAFSPYTRKETARITAQGNILGLLEADVEIVQSSEGDAWGFNLDQYKPTIKLNAPKFGLEFGDMTLNYPNSIYVLKNKSVTGVKVRFLPEPFEFMLVSATPKGISRRTQFYGDGTQGPYDLDSLGNFLVHESETVLLNEQKLKPGSDYLIDDFNGEILFLNRTIGVNDRIEAEYEYVENSYQRRIFGSWFRYESSSGQVFGLDWAWEADNLEYYKDAQAEGLANLEPPVRKTVLDANWAIHVKPSISILETLDLKGEGAWSSFDRDMSTDNHKDQNRFAVQTENKLKGSIYDLTLSGRWVEDDYTLLGNANVREDSWDYKTALNFFPVNGFKYGFFLSELRDRDDQVSPVLIYTKDEMKHNFDIDFSKRFTLNGMRRDFEEGNNISDGSSSLKIRHQENRAEIITRFSNLEISLGAQYNDHERIRPVFSSDRIWETGGQVRVKLNNIPWLSLDARAEMDQNDSRILDPFQTWKAETVLEWKPLIRSTSTNISQTNQNDEYGDKLKFRLSGTWSYGELHRQTSGTNTNISQSFSPADHSWVIETGIDLSPWKLLKHSTLYRINNIRQWDGTEDIEVHEHGLSARTSFDPWKFLFFDHTYRTRFEIAPGAKKYRQWDHDHTGRIRFDPLKGIRTRTSLKWKRSSVRPRLEPDKLHQLTEQEFREEANYLPGKGFNIKAEYLRLINKKAGYYDIGLDDPQGDYSLKPAELMEKRTTGQGEITRSLKSGSLGTYIRFKRYKLEDEWKISDTRYYTVSDQISAAKLSDMNYAETVGGFKGTWSPWKPLNLSFTYSRSILFDKSGTWSQKNTDIFNPSIDISLFGLFKFHTDVQMDASSYTDDPEKPSRIIANSDLSYQYASNLRIRGKVRYEKSKVPDYEYYTGQIDLSFNF